MTWIYVCGQVYRGARPPSCGKSSLDFPLSHWIWPRLHILGTESVMENPFNHSVPSQLTKHRFSLFPLSARGIFSLRLWQVHERSHNHGTGDNGLPNLEYWLSWSHHLPKYQGENCNFKISCFCSWPWASSRWHWKIQKSKKIQKFKNPFFVVGNEQVQGGIEKSKSPLGKTVKGCKCHAGAGN